METGGIDNGSASKKQKVTRQLIENIDISSKSFLRMRESSVAFVDKTQVIAEFLANESISGRCFFSRPRRFGKSLTLEIAGLMLECGNLPAGVIPWRNFHALDAEEVFSGLAAGSLPADTKEKNLLQKPHFVINIFLGSAPTGSSLMKYIRNNLLATAEESFGGDAVSELKEINGLEALFAQLMSYFPEDIPVAILVDEYETAVIQDIQKGKWQCANEGIDALRELMMLSKSARMVKRISHFIVTVIIIAFPFLQVKLLFPSQGVARFARISLFSDAGFTDATGDELVSKMLGFSTQEIFHSYPNALSQLQNNIGKDAMAMLQHMFNGYCFDRKTTCFNPGLVLASLRAGQIEDRLMDGLSRTNWLGLHPTKLMEELLAQATLRKKPSDFDIATLQENGVQVHAVPLLLQLGLLTLVPNDDSAESEPSSPEIGTPWAVPNQFARQVMRYLLSAALPGCTSNLNCISKGIEQAFLQRDHKQVASLLRTFLQSIPTQNASSASTEQGAPYDSALYMVLQVSIKRSTALITASNALDRVEIVISFSGKNIVWLLHIGRSGRGTSANKLVRATKSRQVGEQQTFFFSLVTRKLRRHKNGNI